MPIITVESKRLIEVRTPPHALRAPAPLHPSAPPPHLSRSPTAPYRTLHPRTPSAGGAAQPHHPAARRAHPGHVGHLATLRQDGRGRPAGDHGLVPLPGRAHGRRRARAGTRCAPLELPARAPAPHPRPRPRLAPRTRTRTRTRLPPRSELTLRLPAQLDPDECLEDSECRAVLDGGCMVPEESDESR